MGCCLSTKNSKLSNSNPQKNQHSLVGTQKKSRSDDAKESRAPPPVEEETVKEVLSETPKPKLPSSPLKVETFSKPDEKEKLKDEEITGTQKPVSEKDHQVEEEKSEKKVPILNQAEEISEVSEICSMSESLSTITNITRDEDDEVRQRLVNRSPMKLPKRRNFSGDLCPKRERVAGRSPNRRTDQSPSRRNGVNGVGSVRMVQNRDPGQPMVRRALRTEPHRRDPGESSVRRSRSPATRANVGQIPSARRSGKSPARAAKAPVDNSIRRRVEESSMEDKWPNNSTTNESLENPLVSLECFIFL